MDDKTKRLVEGAEARAVKATLGPWLSNEHYNCIQTHSEMVPLFAVVYFGNGPRSVDDAEFMANARTDVPALCSVVREQSERILELEALVGAWHDATGANGPEEALCLTAQLKDRTEAAAAWALEESKQHLAKQYTASSRDVQRTALRAIGCSLHRQDAEHDWFTVPERAEEGFYALRDSLPFMGQLCSIGTPGGFVTNYTMLNL